jgi:uncharacterized membrane protein YecN with MAPEG domain
VSCAWRTLSEGQVLHAQGIHLCPVPKDKLSMHKTFIYVLFEGQVLHAQGIHLCPVPKDKFSMHNECLVKGELALRTENR